MMTANKPTLQERADEWMRDNPLAMRAIETEALRATHQGIRFSIDQIYNFLRWKTKIETKDKEGFKLNNTYRAYVSRALIKKYPRMKEFLEIRQLSGN